MLSAFLVAWVCAAPQGVEVAVRPASGDASRGALVFKAVRDELSAQGYGPGTTTKPQAEVAPRIEPLKKAWLVTLQLRKVSDGTVIAEERGEAEPDQLERVATALTRQLASQLRQAFGVRVRVKPTKK